MKKLILSFAFMAIMSMISFAQMIDEQNVTVTMDLQPVLQLQMTTPDEVNFIFDDIQSYFGGKTKYAATVLRVSSSVSWDLYAVATSTAGVGAAGYVIWDQQVRYAGGGGANAVDELPVSLLELHQHAPNAYTDLATHPVAADYSPAFISVQDHFDVVGPVVSGLNNVWYSALNTPYTPPLINHKYIQGTAGTGPDQGAPGGSWLIDDPAPGTFSDYYFTIDYRIVPGLPAVFPFATDPDGLVSEDLRMIGGQAYAEPGVYTMNVKYILLEDQ